MESPFGVLEPSIHGRGRAAACGEPGGSLETAIRRLSLFSNGLAVVNGNACYGQYSGLSRTALSRRRLARHRRPRSEWARLIIVLASSNPDPHDIHHVHSPHRRRRLQSSSHTLCTRILRMSQLSNRHQDSASDYYVSSCLDPIHPLHPLIHSSTPSTSQPGLGPIRLHWLIRPCQYPVGDIVSKCLLVAAWLVVHCRR
jgi:hypothetical protein